MPELITPDGKPVAVPGQDQAAAQEAEWGQHMQRQAEAADGDTAPAPPRKDYGVTLDGRPKKAMGRPRKRPAEEQPRVTPPTTTAAGGVKDYQPTLRKICGTAWVVTAPWASADAGAILQATPALVKSWNDVAQSNPRVARLIDRFGGQADMAGVATSTLMLGLQIAANHGYLNAGLLAKLDLPVKTPAELEALNEKALAEVAEAAAEAAA